MKICFIGGGNMAEAMIKGMTSRGMKDILVSEPDSGRRELLEKSYGIETSGSNLKAVSSCNIIILAVKPQIMDMVLDEIKGAVSEEETVVSIAAGITLDHLSSRLKTKKLVRVMPNTPALVQEGMSVMSLCECFTDKEIAVVRDILMSIGKVMVLPEKYMDAVTAVSGSGPGFIAFFIESVIEAGVRAGLAEDDARTLAVQTLAGTSRLLDTGMQPSKLREMVTSPGGTTAAGLNALDEKGFRESVLAAIEAAKNRSIELGKGRN